MTSSSATLTERRRESTAHRKALGLSQEAFAERFKVHRTYMGGLERGERNLTLRAVERMAARLGIEPMTLLGPAKKD
jgi:transcriptional regulator with XRE-family HTH domain